MNRLNINIGALVLIALAIPVNSRGEEDSLSQIFDTIEQAARLDFGNGFFQIQAGGWADWEFYTIDGSPPASCILMMMTTFSTVRD